MSNNSDAKPLKTFGTAAADAKTKWLQPTRAMTKTYKQKCSRCGNNYVTSLHLEAKMGRYRGENGICKLCRDKTKDNSEIRKAQLALAKRRKEMKLKW